MDAAHAEGGGRIAELLAGAKEQAADLVAAGKQQAAGAYVRMADPTPLAGARPGAVGAVVAGCIAAGSGAYCAVEGVPGSIKPVLGIERPAEQAERKPPPEPKREASQLPAPPQVAPAPVPEPAPAPAPRPGAGRPAAGAAAGSGERVRAQRRAGGLAGVRRTRPGGARTRAGGRRGRGVRWPVALRSP